MSDDAYNLTWEQADILAQDGYLVRPIDAAFWYVWVDGVWMIDDEENPRRIVRASEFSRREFRSNAWTTSRWDESNPCLRPPEVAAPDSSEDRSVTGLLVFGWGPGDGADLDIRVAFDDFAPTLDGRDVGWGSSRESIINGPSGKYLWWPADNTRPEGPETVRIDLNAIAQDHPAAATVRFRLRGNWFITSPPPGTKNVSLAFRRVLGGEWVNENGNWVNHGGQVISEVLATRNVTSNSGTDIDGSAMGFLTYNFETRAASFSV